MTRPQCVTIAVFAIAACACGKRGADQANNSLTEVQAQPATQVKQQSPAQGAAFAPKQANLVQTGNLSAPKQANLVQTGNQFHQALVDSGSQ